MSYRVELTPAAERALRKLSPDARRRVQGAIELLSESPRPPGVKKLAAEANLWRVRTGDYRVVYQIHDDVLVIVVVAVGHRREIYQQR